MPIRVSCDVCDSILQDIPTIGVDDDDPSVVVIAEKRCATCTLAAQMDGWPAKLNAIVQKFTSQTVEAQKTFFIANLKSKFVRMAQDEAKAYFGAQYEEALPGIQAEVLSLAETTINVNVTFGG